LAPAARTPASERGGHPRQGHPQRTAASASSPTSATSSGSSSTRGAGWRWSSTSSRPISCSSGAPSRMRRARSRPTCRRSRSRTAVGTRHELSQFRLWFQQRQTKRHQCSAIKRRTRARRRSSLPRAEVATSVRRTGTSASSEWGPSSNRSRGPLPLREVAACSRPSQSSGRSQQTCPTAPAPAGSGPLPSSTFPARQPRLTATVGRGAAAGWGAVEHAVGACCQPLFCCRFQPAVLTHTMPAVFSHRGLFVIGRPQAR